VRVIKRLGLAADTGKEVDLEKQVSALDDFNPASAQFVSLGCKHVALAAD
jgi:hypothetical protein